MKQTAFALAGLIVALPAITFAATDPTLTLINHYTTALTFTGKQNSAETLPDFTNPFVVEKNASASSRVTNGPHAYMRGDGEEKHSVFFGVELVNNEVVMHGYISKGIAYSWKKSVVTFCTPEDYKKLGYCE